MGTRHLIAVQHKGQYKIAQYGQWDGYPSGQGADVLRFLRNMDRDAFVAKLDASQFMTKDEIEEFNKGIDSGAIKDWTRTYPHLSRDAGSEVLKMVAEAAPGIRLIDRSSFAADSLYCEYAYVVDLDKNTFEVFEGFNKDPLEESQRFFGAKADDAAEGYYPVKLVHEFKLDALPTVDEFLAICEPAEQDD